MHEEEPSIAIPSQLPTTAVAATRGISSGAWKGSYRGSGTGHYSDALGRRTFDAPERFFASLGQGDNGNFSYYQLSGSTANDNPAEIDDAKTWAVMLDLEPGGDRITKIGWTFPYPPTSNIVAFNFPLRSKLQWLHLPVGSSASALTHGENPSVVEVRRVSRTSWRFGFTLQRRTSDPNYVRSGYLIFSTDSSKPPWKRIELRGRAVTSNATHEHDFRVVSG